MTKPFLIGAALILLMAFVVACGSAAEPEPTAVPPNSHHGTSNRGPGLQLNQQTKGTR